MSFTDVMKKAFPFLSAAASLGGPVGTIAATMVGKALGVDKAPAATADGISNAIAAAFTDPTQRAALLKAEQDFQLQMAELGYKNAEDLEATAAADRANARNREIQIKDRTPKILAFIVVTLAITGEGFLLVHGQPRVVDGVILGRILGTMDAALMLVLSYYFGSSAGSDRKTELLANGPDSKPA